MNHENDHISRFDDALHEREWLVQENAMRRERLHLDSAVDDFRSRRYRLLARALKAAPAGTPPADFAQQVSALASAQAHEWDLAMTLERALTTALASALLLVAMVVTVIYGATWWRLFGVLLPTPAAARWLLVLIGCLGISWLLGAWSQVVRLANGVTREPA